MNEGPKGRDLFIVDNSVSGWTALRYLEEWTEIAKGFDIATGYFDIGTILAMANVTSRHRVRAMSRSMAPWAWLVANVRARVHGTHLVDGSCTSTRAASANTTHPRDNSLRGVRGGGDAVLHDTAGGNRQV